MKAISIYLSKIGGYLLVIGTVLIFVRKEGLVWLLKPFDIFLLLATIISILYLISKQNARQLKSEDKKILLTLAIFLFSILLATIISYLRYGFLYPGGYYGSFLYFLRFLASIVTLIITYIYLKNNESLQKMIRWSLFSPAILTAALIFPNLSLWAGWLQGNGKFIGLAASQVITASSMLVVFAFAIVIFLKAFYGEQSQTISRKKNWLLIFIYFLLAAASAAILLWTQTRSHWLGAATAALFAISTTAYQNKERLLRNIAVNSALMAAVLAAAFLILPAPIKIVTILRIYPQYTQNYYHNNGDITINLLTKNDLGELGRTIVNKASAKEALSAAINGESRPNMWREYLNNFLKNPLGLGLGRTAKDALSITNNRYSSSHNTLLDLAAWGGIGAVAAFIYLVYQAVMAMRKKFLLISSGDQKKIIYLEIGTALVGLAVASFFENLIFSKLVWILLAMALV